MVLLGGLLLWVFGRSATHIGASGLIFGLITFLMVSGVLEKRLVPLAVCLLVGFLYGGTLLWESFRGSAPTFPGMGISAAPWPAESSPMG